MVLRSSSVQKTYTDNYLHAESHSAQRQSAINLLVHITFTISDKEYLEAELNHLKPSKILQKNGHDKRDINKIISKQIR